MTKRLEALRSLFLAIALCLFASAAQAIPITYRLIFTVEKVEDFYGADRDKVVNPPDVGDRYFATLQVDDSILASDGKAKPGLVLGFHAEIGANTWDPDMPRSGQLNAGNVMAGYRGPCYSPDRTCTDEEQEVWGLGSKYLGFDVENGKVTKLWGGVFSDGDEPFIDFLGDKYSALSFFNAKPEYQVENQSFWQGSYGAIAIHRVPEPSTLALFVITLAALLVARSTQNQAA